MVASTETVDGAHAPAQPKAAPKRSSKLRYLLGIAAIAAAAGGGYTWAHRNLVTTDDAQVDAELVAVPSQAAGVVVAVHFEENQRVKKGDLLVELDDKGPKARVASAKAALGAARSAADAADADANVAKTNATGNRDIAKAALDTATVGAATASDQIKEAQASVTANEIALKQAKLDAERARQLVAAGAISKSDADRAETQLALATANLDAARARVSTLRLSAAQAKGRVLEATARADQTHDVTSLQDQAIAKAKAAHAQVDAAEASLALAELEVEHTKIYAPADGMLSKKTVAVGQFINVGQAIAQLVPNEVWVTANFKETQVATLHPGQPVEVEVDAYGGAKFHGEVESFSGATGSRFALLPPDNASGNFTKVVQRVPVRIRMNDQPEDKPLRPGMSVVVVVDTR